MSRLGRTTVAGFIAAGVILLAQLACAHDGPHSLAETPPAERDLWISLGSRIHGGFGSLIAVGIRIGDDARQRLQAAPRELDVTYYSGTAAPCPCVVDGIMIATYTSPGQRSIRVVVEPATAGEFGRAVVVHTPTGLGLEYVIPQAAAPALLAANKGPPVERWNAIMSLPEEQIFTRRDLTAQTPKER